MSVLLDMDDNVFWEQRAIELLKDVCSLHLPTNLALERLNMAQRLIAMSVAKRRIISESTSQD